LRPALDWTIKTQKKSENKMNCSYNTDRHGERSVSPLLVCDLRAQLAPLNRYGPSGLGVAVADGLHALIGVSRKAVGAALTRSESHQLAA
jgi:hypothetical protein